MGTFPILCLADVERRAPGGHRAVSHSALSSVGIVLGVFLVLIKYRSIIGYFPPFQKVEVFDLTF